MVLAFTVSIGIAFVMIACALPIFQDNWRPISVLVFHLLVPLPTLFARRVSYGSEGGNQYLNLAIFFTMGIVVSAFALPIVFARNIDANGEPLIQFGACILTLIGNVIVFSSIFLYFSRMFQTEPYY